MQRSQRSTISSILQFWPLVIGLVAFFVLANLKPAFALLPDNRQILYWYTGELLSGNGMVFNPGQPVLLIAAPAYILMTAALATFFYLTNLAQIAEWLFVIALLIG